jgi:hypothetical protein
MSRPSMVRALAFLAAGAVGLAACGGGGAATKKTAPRVPRTTTTLAIPTAPLTGLPDPTGVAHGRSALAVKIENTPDARPQSGLDVADVVYEEVVEGGITRFWAVFNSNIPAQLVGPIRSVRAMDPNVVSPVGGVVAFSGGAAINVAAIRQAPVVSIDEDNANNGAGELRCETNTTDAFCRSSKKAAPHNLFGRPDLLLKRGGKPVPPLPLFTYPESSSGQSFTGTPVTQFKVNFRQGYDATYQWDPATGWKRLQQIFPFLSDTGQQVTATNVIVQFTPYTGDGEGQLIGQGDAWIFSNGQLIKGHWTKSSATQATQYTDAAGAPIALTPGRTWVEFLPTGLTVDLTTPPPVPSVPTSH